MQVGQLAVLPEKYCFILYYGLLSDNLRAIGGRLFLPLLLPRRLLFLFGQLLVCLAFPAYLVDGITGLLAPGGAGAGGGGSVNLLKTIFLLAGQVGLPEGESVGGDA